MKLDDLPLFASDEEVANAILGKRTKGWKLLVLHYEGRGLPPLDAFTGGRFVPAVRQFFDALHARFADEPTQPCASPQSFILASGGSGRSTSGGRT